MVSIIISCPPNLHFNLLSFILKPMATYGNDIWDDFAKDPTGSSTSLPHNSDSDTSWPPTRVFPPLLIAMTWVHVATSVRAKVSTKIVPFADSVCVCVFLPHSSWNYVKESVWNYMYMSTCTIKLDKIGNFCNKKSPRFCHFAKPPSDQRPHRVFRKPRASSSTLVELGNNNILCPKHLSKVLPKHTFGTHPLNHD